MAKYTKKFLWEAHRFSSQHKEEILRSEICGCFFCTYVFPPQEIDSWANIKNPNGATAVCPQCYIDAVLGSTSGLPVTDKDFLKEMGKAWFGSQHEPTD